MSSVISENKSNLPLVSIEDFHNLIKQAMRGGIYKPILGLGPVGIGKSAGIRQLCADNGWSYMELRLLNLDESDLHGVPTVERIKYRDLAKTRTNAIRNSKPASLDRLTPEELDSDFVVSKWAPNALLPIAERDGDEGILVIDEITSAKRSMRTLIYQLLDGSRSVGEYRLPDKWLIVCMGNGEEDGGDYEGIEFGVFTRGGAVRIEADARSWIKWARNNDCDPRIIAYLDAHPEHLHTMPGGDQEPGQCATPRGWYDILNNWLKVNPGKVSVTDPGFKLYAQMAVGVEVGIEFVEFCKAGDDAINPDDILNGEIDAEKFRNLQRADRGFRAALYLTQEALLRRLFKVIKEGRMPDFEDGGVAAISEEAAKKFKNFILFLCQLHSGGDGLNSRAVAIDILQQACLDEVICYSILLGINVVDKNNNVRQFNPADDIPEFAELTQEHLRAKESLKTSIFG